MSKKVTFSTLPKDGALDNEILGAFTKDIVSDIDHLLEASEPIKKEVEKGLIVELKIKNADTEVKIYYDRKCRK